MQISLNSVVDLRVSDLKHRLRSIFEDDKKLRTRFLKHFGTSSSNSSTFSFFLSATFAEFRSWIFYPFQNDPVYPPYLLAMYVALSSESASAENTPIDKLLEK